MSILDKLVSVGEVVANEYQRHFGEDDPDGEVSSTEQGEAAFMPPVRAPEEAYERLGLSDGSTLDEVRAAYRDLARTWHPRAQQEGAEAERAKKHLDGYLDALEVLEEHLLPLAQS